MKLLCLLVLAASQVIQIIEVCRHGFRTPTAFYPWDTLWTNAPGELVPVGMRMHFLLGSELRQRYVVEESLLQPSYNASTAYFRSTDVNRTIMSAQSQLMGLFPPPTGPVLEVSLASIAVPPIHVEHLNNLVDGLQSKALPAQTQPVPVEVYPAAVDYELQADSACSLLKQNILALSPNITQVALSNQFVYQTLLNSGYFPSNSTLLGKYKNVLDDLLINSQAAHQLPAAFSAPDFLGNVSVLFNQLFSLPYRDPWNARLFASAFFLDLNSQLQLIAGNHSFTPFRLYSAHDTTIAGFLAGLQVFDFKQPPFASTLIFETSRQSGQLYMRVIYNDQPLLIPTCPSALCPLQTFIDYLNYRSILNLSDICNTNSSIEWSTMEQPTSGESLTPGKGSTEAKWVGWLAVGLVCLVLLSGAILCVAAKQRRKEDCLPLMKEMDQSSSSVGERKIVNLAFR